MPDSPATLAGVPWDSLALPAPAYGVGEVLTHPVLGEVTVVVVDATGDFPVYLVQPAQTKQMYRTSAAFLS